MSIYGATVLSSTGGEQWTSDTMLLSYSHRVYATRLSDGRVWVSERTPVAYQPTEGDNLNVQRSNTAGSVETWPNGQRALMNYSMGTGYIIYYDEVIPTIQSSYGLASYSMTGELDYCTDQKPMKILDIVSIPDIRTVATTVDGQIVYWSKQYLNKDVACLFIKFPIFQDWYLYTASPALRNGVFSMEKGLHRSISESEIGTHQSSWTLQCLIVEVTGYT